MARPIESPSGLPRQHVTLRIDPFLLAYAKKKEFNLSNGLEQAVIKQCGLDAGTTPEFVKHIALVHLSADTYKTKAELDAVSIDWQGEVVSSMCRYYRAIDQIVEHMADYRAEAEGFDKDDIKAEWPNEEDWFNCAFRFFYCEENDTFGAMFLTRAAWKAQP